MYFVDNGSAVPVMPQVKPVSSATPQFFTEGGNGTPPTYPGPDWFNIFQLELLNVLKEAQIDPDKANHTQLVTAMKKLFLDASLNGSDIADKAAFLSNLGLGTAAKKNTGSNPGDVVTAGSDQPVYNSTLPTSEYASISHSGYMGNATVTGGDTMVRLAGLIANNVAGNWTLFNSYGSHFGTGGSIQPEDSAHILVSTDGASYTRRWYFYNNGKLVGPTGEFGNMAWVNSKVGTVDGVITLGNGINVKKVDIPDLPLLGYTGTSSRGILATATGPADSVTKAHSIQLTKPGAGGWGLNMSWGTYVGASGSVDDVAHLLCASDGAAFSRQWWFYNNGNLVGPSGNMASQGWVSTNFAPIGSDVAIKDNVEPINLDDALTFVRNNQTYSWDYKADGRHYVGFITEELKRDNPELVYAIGDMEINGEVIKGVEGTSAGNIAAGYLFPVVKHLLERAEAAEEKLVAFESRLAALEAGKA
ncbi:TPA: tail fiber domain-containing protein [Citrobacter freundii]|nr:tail fiber domain-containing protein [Citrobacter freundii]